MDVAQILVSLALQSQGYFVIEGALAPRNREADILAIRLGQDGLPCERLHCEVQVSTDPIGFLRGHATLRAKEPRESAAEYVKRKFFAEPLLQVVRSRLGGEPDRRLFVHGRLNEASQLEVFHELDIETAPFEEIIRAGWAATPVRAFKRAVEVAALLGMAEP